MQERKKLGRGLEEISHLFLSSEEESPSEKKEPARLISAVSGTWGIEKAFLLGNIALKLAAEGHRVTVLSFNPHVPTVNFLLYAPSGEPVLQLAEEGRSLADAIVEGPMGVQLVTGGGDLSNLGHLRADRRDAVVRWLKELEDKNDFLFLDVTPFSISFAHQKIWRTQEVMVLTSPDVAGMLNAYRIVKAVLTGNRTARLGLIVYRVKTIEEAKVISEKMGAVTKEYLGASIENWGFLFDDLDIPRSIWGRRPFALIPSGSRVEECLSDIAQRIVAEKAPAPPVMETPKSEFQGTGPRSEPPPDLNTPHLE